MRGTGWLLRPTPKKRPESDFLVVCAAKNNQTLAAARPRRRMPLPASLVSRAFVDLLCYFILFSTVYQGTRYFKVSLEAKLVFFTNSDPIHAYRTHARNMEHRHRKSQKTVTREFSAGLSRVGPRVDSDKTHGSIRGSCQSGPCETRVLRISAAPAGEVLRSRASARPVQ